MTFRNGFSGSVFGASSDNLIEEHAGPDGLHVIPASATKHGAVEIVVLGRPRVDNRQEQHHECQRYADTILRYWRKYGCDLMAHVGGHFAFALFDSGKNEAVLAVDRFATVPIYWASAASGGFGFGTSLGDVSRRTGNTATDPQAIYAYVYSHVIPGPQSIFRKVRKVPPASIVLLTPGQDRVIEYWRPSFEAHDGDIDRRGEELLTIIRDAVRRDMTSSATGCFLSGGLDSSTVSGMHAQLTDRASDAFTIGFDAPGYDEMKYSETVARHFELSLHDYYLTAQDIVDCMPRVAGTFDEPFGNSSAVGVYVCARMARDHGVSVLLAGDGGDELFGGNERYLYQQYFRPYEILPEALRKYVIDPATRQLPTNAGPALLRKAGRYFEQARIPLPDRLEEYNFLHRNRPDEVFEPSFFEQVDPGLPLEAKRKRYRECDAPTPLQRMLYLDWKYTLTDNDLRKVGDMCALAGIDARYPLLDDDVVDFACRLPASWLIRGNDLRHFFRRTVSGFLPRETLTKSKHGFGLPFGLWLRTNSELGDLVGDSIASLGKRQIFRGAFLDKMQTDHRTEHAAYYGELIWILTMLELWFQVH